jgi:aryl-alcohol dehydrogenase-like predicted oxidoreductase
MNVTYIGVAMKTGKIKSRNGYTELSRMIFGASHLGTRQNREESFRLLDMLYEASGRTIETGRSSFEMVPFGASQSEKTIRDWMRMRGTASEMMIVTKGGHPDMRNMNWSRLDRKSLEHDIMTSLAVLDVEKVAGFILHRDDERIPVMEIMDVLDDIVQRGYAEFVCASNWTIARINEANAYAAKKGQVQFTASSILWNLGRIEPETFWDNTQVYMDDGQYAGYLENKIPVLAFSSQAVGYFSKLLSGQELGRSPRVRAMDTEENRRRAERLREVCAQYNVSAGAICLAYIACNKVEGYPIFSCSSEKQFEEARQAFDLDITQKDIDFIVKG